MNADAVVDRILSSIDKLGEFPSMGRVGQVEGTREWVVPRLPYQPVDEVGVGWSRLIVEIRTGFTRWRCDARAMFKPT